jgi:hypothetical protein
MVCPKTNEAIPAPRRRNLTSTSSRWQALLMALADCSGSMKKHKNKGRSCRDLKLLQKPLPVRDMLASATGA